MRSLALAMIAACGNSPAPDTRDGAPVTIDAVRSIDAAPPPSTFPDMVTIDATHGTLANPFTATIDGSGISIANDTGTIDSTSAALYNSVPFGTYQIFGSIVVAPDRWTIAYPYCMNGSLVDLYAEQVGPGGFVLTQRTGTCSSTTASIQAQVDLPSFSIATPSPVGNATVHGAAIDLDHGVGTIAIDNVKQPAVVFDTVDCSSTCGSPGWYELHTLIYDDTAHTATFAIVYLKIGTANSVQVSYAMRLPTLDDPFHDAVLDATWTGTAARTLDHEPLHLPPPWQR
ncbi:MAG: hypothetical protein QM831_31955 [Kofleriaceae bacterium]